MMHRLRPLRPSPIRLSSAFRGIGSLAIPLFLLPLGLPIGCSHPQARTDAAETPVANVVAVQRGSIAHTLSLAGQFQPYQMVEVHAKVAGYIRRINVDIGDKVRKGQVLATLEVPELSAQLKGTVSELAHSRDEIARAKNDVTRAESLHGALHTNYVRLRDASASQPGIVAQQELDDARSKDLASEAQVEGAKSALSGAEQQSGVASADNERVGALAGYATVTAPLAGVIIWRYADTGALIQAGTASSTQSMPIVKLSQSDLLRLRLPVPEDDVQYIRVGAPVTVHVGALNRSFTGTVVRFTHDISLQTHTMETEVDVPNANLSIDPGMYADVSLQLEHKNNILTVPEGAVVRNGTESTVLVLDGDNRVQSKAVTLGIQGSTLLEVTSGLREGDRVIDGGQSKYQVGEIVQPHTEKLNPNDQKTESGSEAAGGQN